MALQSQLFFNSTYTKIKKKLIVKGDFYKKDSDVSISKRETNYLQQLQVCVL